MNILTITANDNGIGGASRIAMDLHDYYLKSGFRSHVLAGKKVTSLPSVTELRRPLWRKVAARVLSNDFELFDGKQVLQSNCFKDADIVHCHNLHGWYFDLKTLIEMAKLKPVVWTLHDMWAITPHSAYSASRELENGLFKVSHPDLYPSTLWNNDRYLSLRKTKIIDAADIHFVTPCNWLAELTDMTCLKNKPKTIIHNGIDTTQFVVSAKVEAKSRLGLSEEPVVLYLGAASNKDPIKGYEDFEQMALDSVSSKLQFVRLGAVKDGMIANVRQFAATSDKERISTFLSAADVLVLPSRFEVFGLVMIEAMACGTPVVAYDVGGVGEVLENAPGCFLIEPENRMQLQEATMRAAQLHDDVKAKISREVRTFVESKFSLHIMGEKYVSLLHELIALNGRSTLDR